jgi:hypothetical protein
MCSTVLETINWVEELGLLTSNRNIAIIWSVDDLQVSWSAECLRECIDKHLRHWNNLSIKELNFTECNKHAN